MQIIKVTGKKLVAYKAPEWMKKSVSGKEAIRRAQEYEAIMQKLASGYDIFKVD
ncbi:hypothetical protein SC206_16395 [Rouxiella sp. T17]|uniref:hypothetical protein n=1 Tax=Rouxiella sp. T17 TaxID=3085684 RepID=UPI002FC6A168